MPSCMMPWIPLPYQRKADKEMDVLYTLSVLLAFALIQAYAVRRFGLTNFSYRRSFSKKYAFEGETVEFIEVIQNKKIVFIPWMRLENKISPDLIFQIKEEVNVSGRQYHKSVFSLLPYSRVTRRHRVFLNKRGYYHISSSSVTWGDLWGISAKSQEITADASLCVYPRILKEDEISIPSSRWSGSLAVKRWIINDPFLINGIRPYCMGDQPHDIHWAASARTGELQIKTFDKTADPKLLILLNVQMTEGQWSDLMDYEQKTIEYCISLAATLSLKALESRIETGFAANMPTDDGKECTVLLPRYHQSRADELLSAFAHLRIFRIKSFTTFLDELGPLQNMDILILSEYDSEAIQERMQAFRAAGNTVELQLLHAAGGQVEQ